jgi:NAD(P)-dependent dehydrogenase (short-subunit alcohol dehydrogenase family)
MDSLRNGFTALVIGASGGIGGPVAASLDTNPRCGAVVRLSRRDGHLDLTDPASVAAAAALFADAHGYADLVFDATGVLEVDGHGPEKSLRQVHAGRMAPAFAINAIGPALLLQYFAPLLPRQGKSIFATLSARVGSIGDNRLGGWVAYRASKAALNQIVRTGAIEIARTRPNAVCAALHPGTVETDLTRRYARDYTLPPAECAQRLLGVLDGLGPNQSGGFFDYDGREVPW